MATKRQEAEKPKKVSVYLPEMLAHEAKVAAAVAGISLSDWMAEATEAKLALQRDRQTKRR